ncbi:Glycerol kinase [Streptomyces afghaniensis]
MLTAVYTTVPLSGAHLNPAVTLALAIKDGDWKNVPVYWAGHILGAMIGAALVWIAYYGQFHAHLTDREIVGGPGAQDTAAKAVEAQEKGAGPVLDVFSTGPEVRVAWQNVATEIIGTVVLVLAVLTQGLNDKGNGLGTLGALITALVVVSSACPSAARRGTRSTRPVTSVRASCTPCCRCPTRAAPTGATPGPRGGSADRRRHRGRHLQRRIRLRSNPRARSRNFQHAPYVKPLKPELSGAHSDRRAHRRPLHRRHRPGHHLFPLHRLRPRRPDRLRRPEGARADLPEAGLGRAQRHRDLDQRPGGRRRGHREGRHHPRRHQGHRHHQPARDAPRRGTRTGEPVHNAIVWQDTRTDALCRELGRNVGQDRFRRETGLPLASYFAGPKARWLLDNVDGLKRARQAGDILFDTMDTWVIWNLTGGVDGGKHVTDVTNASRTMLMNLHTMEWDDKICESIGVPKQILPEIRSSAEVYGEITGGKLGDLLGGIPVASALGDQQAARSRQTCFAEGETKSTTAPAPSR